MAKRVTWRRPAGATLQITKNMVTKEQNQEEQRLRRASRTVLSRGKAASAKACIAAYDLALLLLQLGREREADELLGRLGFSCRLDVAIFSGATIVGTSRGAKSLTTAFDGVLPPALLSQAQTAFARDSPFWSAHGYPTPSFFSYNEPLGRARVASVSTSRVPLIHAIVDNIAPLVESAFPFVRFSNSRGASSSARQSKRTRKVGSVEWWAHTRPCSGGGHQMHFDLDEAGLPHLPEGALPGHPLVSCVLYLSGVPAAKEGRNGAEEETEMTPTLVTDQTLAPGSVASRGWLCSPRLNRLLMFDGGLLHGVVPRLSLKSPTRSVDVEERVTLMLGFWGDDPAPVLHDSSGGVGGDASAGENLGPNMVLSRGSRTVAAKWTKIFKVLGGPTPPRGKRARSSSPAGRRSSTSPKPALLSGPVHPIWVDVPRPPSSLRSSEGSVDFVGRWFLEGQPETLQEHVVADARRSRGDGFPGDGPVIEEQIECEEMSMDELRRLRSLSDGAGGASGERDLRNARGRGRACSSAARGGGRNVRARGSGGGSGNRGSSKPSAATAQKKRRLL
eukprot:TRINITY_DN74271_c0_g1_i1.p1 TRINITY_DN74271_c0_g1~~TRINITY_DN74271_c0_g1_i1.p1  ORF type:complete len:595 (+),score=92.81 TRINITY_DN74271_c0_g1_i1:100-1785(+)